MRVSADLQAGSVWVNQYGILHNSVPFGGYKVSRDPLSITRGELTWEYSIQTSGHGRELGGAGIHEYMNVSLPLPLSVLIVNDWTILMSVHLN